MKTKTIVHKSAAPIYAAAVTWVLYALLFPLYQVGHFLLAAAASAVVALIARMFCRDVTETVEVPEEPVSTGNVDLDKAIAKVFENENLEILVLKNGSRGSQIYTRNGLEVEQGVYKVVQEDATGAGDSYDAAFICGLAEGKTLAEAAKMGAAAGALNAAAFGPMEGKISRETVFEMIEKNS